MVLRLALAHRWQPMNENDVVDVRLDDELRRIVVGLVAIDRAVSQYHRKQAGLEPWTRFEAPARPERSSQ